VKPELENSRLEAVENITHWVRGKEHLTLFSPRPFPANIPLIGLGLSVGGNITGDVIVVNNLTELQNRGNEVSGKIVLINQKW
jgi:hypothetical protein